MGSEEEGMWAPVWWSSWSSLAVAVTAGCLLLHVAARVADALWWRPRRLEAHFARQGVRGPPYRFLFGSVREMVALMVEATAKPMSPATSHNALPRVLAFYHYWRKIYGMPPSLCFLLSHVSVVWLHVLMVVSGAGPTFLIWFGPTPRLTVAEPELIREIFLTRAEAFDRYEAHPVVRQLEGDGLVSLHGDKWGLHRRVLTPAFYPDNLNVRTNELRAALPPWPFGHCLFHGELTRLFVRDLFFRSGWCRTSAGRWRLWRRGGVRWRAGAAPARWRWTLRSGSRR
jgi:PHYB activation tagged suppressor 1